MKYDWESLKQRLLKKGGQADDKKVVDVSSVKDGDALVDVDTTLEEVLGEEGAKPVTEPLVTSDAELSAEADALREKSKAVYKDYQEHRDKDEEGNKDKEERHKELQKRDIDEMTSDDLAEIDEMSIEDAHALVTDAEVDDDDDEIVDEDDLALEEVDEDEEADIEPSEDELLDELASVDAKEEQADLTPEQAKQYLTPVQRAILAQMEKIDYQTRKTEAQLTEENLYMQGQILEWSNAYAALMERLDEWQEYGAKMHAIVVKQDQEFEKEKDALAKRQRIQLRSVQQSLEEEYDRRQAALQKNQANAEAILAEAKQIKKEARDQVAAAEAKNERLQQQLITLTTHPTKQQKQTVPIAPGADIEALFKEIKTKPKTSVDANEPNGIADVLSEPGAWGEDDG